MRTHLLPLTPSILPPALALALPLALLASCAPDYGLNGEKDPDGADDTAPDSEAPDSGTTVVDACEQSSAEVISVALNDACQVPPAQGGFTPEVEWSLSGYQGYGPPAVAQLDDDNGDGVVDAGDIPDIVYVANTGQGIICVDGRSGRIKWTSTAATDITSAVAIGDVDADGDMEIVASNGPSQIVLLDHLGIETLHAVIGPSVGGLVALTFASRFPQRVRNVIAIASGFKTTVLNRLILFEQILAIENDPHFNGGDYYDGAAPLYGLALARMISHKTFVHLDAIERRARQDVVQPDDVLAWYRVRDQFQSYMLHQGKKFVGRFDANTYLRIIDLWSRYDATHEGDAETPEDLFERARLAGQNWLVFSIDSDFCFYPEEQAELVKHLENAKVDVMHIIVHSDKGHDSFLLEPNLYTPHIAWLLANNPC